MYKSTLQLWKRKKRMSGKLFHDCSTRLLGPHTGTCARAGTTHPLCACPLLGPAVLAFCFRTKVDGQDQRPKRGSQAQSQGQGQDTATAAGLEILEAILGPFGNVN